MKRQFGRVEDFFDTRERCLFCSSPLKVVLTNYSASANHIPILTARPINGKFSFHLRHTTEKFDFDADAELDIRTNNLFFSFKEEPDPYSRWQETAKKVFENLGPHLELACRNKQCKKEYTLSSERFVCDYHGDFLRIKPFNLFAETFVTGKHWVMNDWISHKTIIFSQANIEAEPIKTGLLDSETMSGDKILNRVQMLVTFS